MDKLDMTLCSARPGAMAAAMLAGLSLLIVTGAALGDTVTAALEKGKDAVKWRLSGA